MDTPHVASPDVEQSAPRAPLATDTDHTLAVGIEVARDRVRVALVDAAGVVRARAERRDVQAAPAARARAAAALARSCSEDVEDRLDPGRKVEVVQAVAGFPAVVGPDGATVRRVPGYEKGGTGLRDALADALGCPVTVENDVNLAALAEHRIGAARTAATSVTFVLGDGFGAGTVLDGRIHHGATGLAGEVAFLPQPNRALGEQVLGDVALAAIAKEHGLPENIGLHEVLDRADAGNGSAVEAVDEIARRVAVVTASVALVLDPEVFVLADQAARPVVHDRVAGYLRQQVSVLPVTVVASTLGADATVLGAGQAASEALR